MIQMINFLWLNKIWNYCVSIPAYLGLKTELLVSLFFDITYLKMNLTSVSVSVVDTWF